MNNKENRIRNIHVKELVFKILIYTFLIICAVAVIFPFYWMVLTSFKSYGAYNAEVTPTFFTLQPTFENYITVFTSINLGQEILNTVIFAVVTTILMCIVSILAAFAFARLDFKGKNIVFTLFLALMMIPTELMVITNYVTVTTWGLRNTLTGIILPSVTSVFYIYLLRENFNQVGDTLYLAAKVDGTSDFKYLWKVIVPICKPTIISMIILKLIECWNSYVWPRLVIDNSKDYMSKFIVSLGIQYIRENGFGRENIPAMLAAVCIVSLPFIVIYIIFRKQIMNGVSRGGTKG